jgi:hypothetical protein
MANLGNGQQYKQSRDFAAATGLVQAIQHWRPTNIVGISKRETKICEGY